jgi:hypothetical protein
MGMPVGVFPWASEEAIQSEEVVGVQSSHDVSLKGHDVSIVALGLPYGSRHTCCRETNVELQATNIYN